MKLRTNAMPPDATSKAHIFKFHKIGELHTCDIKATVGSTYRSIKRRSS